MICGKDGFHDFIVILLAFGAYDVGIFLRAKILTPFSKLSLLRQFLLGIPVSLVVVALFLPVIQKTIDDFSVW